MSTTNLGAELQQLSHLLEVLIIKEPDATRAKLLSDIHQDVLSEIRALVSANIDAATQQYAAASSAVEQANDNVLEAIKDLEKVADTIKTVAKVVDVLRQLTAAVI